MKTTKTHTRSLRLSDYVSDAGQLSLCKLVDDACESLGTIRNCGVGQQRKRSRGVIFGSFCRILVAAGYSDLQARQTWRDQVVAIDELNACAEEE